MHLRTCRLRGPQAASDMVPNHMGIDSDWVVEHPDWFLFSRESPYPVYRFEGPDISTDSRVEIKIEDHYYDHSDAASVLRLTAPRPSADICHHGNDNDHVRLERHGATGLFECRGSRKCHSGHPQCCQALPYYSLRCRYGLGKTARSASLVSISRCWRLYSLKS